MNKTNVIRMLEKAKIPFEAIEYEVSEDDLSAEHIAKIIGLDPKTVFKTLVTHGDRHGYTVFCIPCEKEVDLKKAAKITGDKKIEFVHVKDLLKITGYIRGGCSPVGMKKKFPTYFDNSALDLQKISVSGGVRGLQVILNPKLLISYINAFCEDVTL